MGRPGEGDQAVVADEVVVQAEVPDLRQGGPARQRRRALRADAVVAQPQRRSAGRARTPASASGAASSSRQWFRPRSRSVRHTASRRPPAPRAAAVNALCDRSSCLESSAIARTEDGGQGLVRQMAVGQPELFSRRHSRCRPRPPPGVQEGLLADVPVIGVDRRAAQVEVSEVRHGDVRHPDELLRVDAIGGQVQAPQGRQAGRIDQGGGTDPLAIDVDQFEGFQPFPQRRREGGDAPVAQRAAVAAAGASGDATGPRRSGRSAQVAPCLRAPVAHRVADEREFFQPVQSGRRKKASAAASSASMTLPRNGSNGEPPLKPQRKRDRQGGQAGQLRACGQQSALRRSNDG